MNPEPASLRKLNREQRAELHYEVRGQWLRIRRTGQSQVTGFGIASLSDPGRFYLCDDFQCTCPDYRFHGLNQLRIGRAGAHQPCSHVIAVRRVLTDAQAAIAESHNTPPLRLVR